MLKFITKKAIIIFILIFITLGSFFAAGNSKAAINKQFNYQGKLTDSSRVAVTDGVYDVVFKLYTVAGGGAAVWTESWTNAALWTETSSTTVGKDHADCGGAGYTKITYVTTTNESTLASEQTLWNITKGESAVIKSVTPASDYVCIYNSYTDWVATDDLTNRIYVKDGLFSTMVGSVTAQTVDFSANTYYLGVTIGSDSEMIPRKRIGSVPQAWNANNIIGDGYVDIDNTLTSQDAVNISYNPASGAYDALDITYGSGGGTGVALTVTQSGTGNSLSVDQNGNVGSTLTTDGALFIENTGNTGIGFNVYSNIGATADASLAYLTADNTGFDQEILTVRQDGTGSIASFTNTATATSAAFTISNLGSGNSFVVNDEASDTTSFVIDESGNVGIGTATPSATLDVYSGSLKLSSSDVNYYTDFINNVNANTAFEIQHHGQTILKSSADAFNAVTLGNNNAFIIVSPQSSNIQLTGQVGIGTTAPDKPLEINAATGGNLRLTYNDSDGSATNYNDFAVDSSGDLTITASGGDISFGDENLSTTGTADFGATTVDSLNVSSGGITNVGAISGTGNITFSGSPTLKLGTAGGTLAITDSDDNTLMTLTDSGTSGILSSIAWNGTAIGTQYGGTGQDFSATAQGNVPYFSDTGTLSTLAPGTSGYYLKTQGAGADPTWSQVVSVAGPTLVVAASNSLDTARAD